MLEHHYSNKLQDILNNYEIESNLPDEGYIEVYWDGDLRASTKEDAENNLSFDAIAKLEVAQGLSKGTPVNGLENLTIQAVHDDKVDTLFNTDKNGTIETNIAKPPQPAIERIQDLLESKKLKAQGLKELTEIVSELAKQVQLQNEFIKEQSTVNKEQQNLNQEQEAFNDVTSGIVSKTAFAVEQLDHNRKSKEISDFFVNVARSQENQKFTKEGEQYVVSANSKGDVRIWEKDNNTLIYAQKENNVELNFMEEKDVDNLLNAKNHHNKIQAQKNEQEQPQLENQVQNQLPQQVQEPVTRGR